MHHFSSSSCFQSRYTLSAVEGYVLCEQMRYIDLKARRWFKLSATHYFDIMDISDAVMGIFDWQQL